VTTILLTMLTSSLLGAAPVPVDTDPLALPPVQVGPVGKAPRPVFRIARPQDSPLQRELDLRARAAMGRGLIWLREHADERGGWLLDLRTTPTDAPPLHLSPVGAAVSALGLKAFAQASVDPSQDALLRDVLQNLLNRQVPDGRFDEGNLSSYVTATVVTALAALPEHTAAQQAAHAGAAALRRMQWDDTEGIGTDHDWFGGAGYGNRGRPDLSNTQWMLEALHAAGDCTASAGALGCDCDNDPNRRNAIAFLTRCQNASTNSARWAGDDGGFVYTPAGNGESMASQAAGEGRYGEKLPPNVDRSLRSYGSMTYAGYKSLLFAGLPADDPRVTAALQWIRAHWTLKENPGMGRQGWYYYLHALARAMRAGEHDVIIDDKGVPHAWRNELVEVLLAAQSPDGSWTNEEKRWLEGETELTTIYALLALQEALKGPPSP
jgi:squalene-hopene/tetraprenyl-beta-curcumene cyclase